MLYEGAGFVESAFLRDVHSQGPANVEMVMNW